MGGRLEGTNYQRQVVYKRVLLERGECGQRFVAPIEVHKLYEVVCSKITKRDVTKINQLVADNVYQSRSSLIRKAIQELLKTHTT